MSFRLSQVLIEQELLMKRLNGSLWAIIIFFTCLLLGGFIFNQLLMKRALKKSERIFSDNQYAQTRIIADAFSREVGGIASTTKVMARTAFADMLEGGLAVNEVRNILSLEMREHDIIDGFVVYDRSGKSVLEVGRSPGQPVKLLNAADLYSRSAWFEFQKSVPQKILTFTHVSKDIQQLILIVPIRFAEKLQGVVVQVVNLSPLIDLYFKPIRFAGCCAAFMLSGRGTVIYDHNAEIIGKNVFQGIHNDFPELIELDRRMITEDSGQGEYYFPTQDSGESVRKLISWNTAQIGSQEFVVAIAVPDKVIVGIVDEARYVHFFSDILVGFIFILGGYVIVRRYSEQKIKDNEKRLVLALEGNRDGVWDWDIKKGEVYYSRRWKEMLGYDESEIDESYHEWESRIHPEDVSEANDRMDRHLKGLTDFYEGEQRLRCKNGSYKWILGRGKVYSRDRNGNPERMIGTNTDITEKKKAELQITKLSLAVENSPSAVVITDPEGTIEYVNRGFEEITGYRYDEAVGRNPSELIKSGSHQEAIYRDLWETISNGKVWRGELTNNTRDGDVYWCRLSVSPVLDDKGDVVNYVGVQEDLTALKVKEAELERLATVDELTGINNRRHFINMAEREMNRTNRHGSCMSLSMLDIDHFKGVNDTYGHDYGDFVLKEMAAVVLGVIRDIDTFGRIGGEEFALILSNTDARGASILLERLRLEIEKHDFIFNEIKVNITVSFGYVVYNEGSSEDFDQLMKKADRALYLASQS